MKTYGKTYIYYCLKITFIEHVYDKNIKIKFFAIILLIPQS